MFDTYIQIHVYIYNKGDRDEALMMRLLRRFKVFKPRDTYKIRTTLDAINVITII